MTDQGAMHRRRESIDDLGLLLNALPPDVLQAVHRLTDPTLLIEIVMDLGRRPEARFIEGEVTLLDREISEADLKYVVEHIGTFGDDNRAGIEQTLHRISAIRNRTGKIVGLTCRIGRAVYGTIDIILDCVERGSRSDSWAVRASARRRCCASAARVLATTTANGSCRRHVQRDRRRRRHAASGHRTGAPDAGSNAFAPART